MTTTTTGFLDALANYLASVSSLSLTKGTNLFAQDQLDDPDTIETDATVLFDRGYSELTDRDYIHLTWTIDIWANRKVRLTALDAVKSVQDAILRKRFRMTSDALESYQVVTVRIVEPGSVLTEKAQSGRYLAESSLEFEVIPC